MKLKQAERQFVNRINRAIEEEDYDDLNMDEWEIIEILLDIIETYTRE